MSMKLLVIGPRTWALGAVWTFWRRQFFNQSIQVYRAFKENYYKAGNGMCMKFENKVCMSPTKRQLQWRMRQGESDERA